MFQFTTTTVINSNLDSNGTLAKYAGTADAFRVTRVGTFKKDNIKSVYERAYAAPTNEVATITVPTVSAGKVIRLEVDVRLSQNTYSEYANSYLYFKKPVVVEVIATGIAADDATALKKQVSGLQDRFGESYIKATAVGAVLTLTAKNQYQRFHNAEISEEVLSPNSLVQPEYKAVSTDFAVTIPGKVGFGDDAYMISSIMVPTTENTRAFGINQEERPILGGNYSQFTLRYDVPKDSDDGVWAGARSITTHVFYVKSDLVAAFKAELLKTVTTLNSLSVSAADTALVVGSDDTEVLVVTGAIGSVTYATSDATVATVAAGTVTAIGAGSATITVTDAAGNTASIDFAVTV